MNRQQLERTALAAADRCLKARGYSALDEVFREMGKLDPKHWDDWRRGRVPYLERVIRLDLSQINAVCRAVQASARRGNLKRSGTAYLKWGRGPRTPLRFTKSGDPHLERSWATRHVRTQPRSAKADATAESAKGIHDHGGSEPGLDSAEGVVLAPCSRAVPSEPPQEPIEPARAPVVRELTIRAPGGWRRGGERDGPVSA